MRFRSLFSPLLLTAAVLACGTARLLAQQAPTPGTILTVAGTGPAGFSPDGTPAIAALLNAPSGLTLDARGALIFIEHLNQRVRTIREDGTLATVAGTGTAGFSGESGPAREMQLFNPVLMTADAVGNLYVAEFVTNRVRKITPDGLLETVAGSGPATDGAGAFRGDGGPATAARLNGPAGLAVDAEGSLYIADGLNRRVRRVDPGGTITTVAGGGARPPADAEEIPAIEVRLGRPMDVAVDAVGNLYVADFELHRIFRIDRRGLLKTVAGTGRAGDAGDNGPAARAELRQPIQVAVDSAGSLFIADSANYRVRKVAPDGTITTVAGNGTPRYTGEGGPATATGLRGPGELAIDAAGNLYLADSQVYKFDGVDTPNERILKIVGMAAPGLLAGRPFAAP